MNKPSTSSTSLNSTLSNMRFDADRHLIEPMSIWQDYIDTQIAQDYPITIVNDNAGNTVQLIKDMPLFANVNSALLKNYAKKQHNIAQQQDAMSHQGQIRTMDEGQISQAAIYPTFATYIVNHDKIPAHVSLAYAQGYNQWLKTFCHANPKRLLGVAMVSRHDTSNLVSQLTQIIDNGFNAITLRPEIIAGKTLGHPDYQPFWQACEAHNIAITIHGGTNLCGATVGSDRFTTRFGLHACSHPMEIQMAFVSLLESGVLERHPKLKFAFLEAGASWIPHWLWRLDNICYPETQELVSKHIKMKPSAYFKRQCWVAIELGEYCLRQAADIIGHDKLLFGSDFPHPDHSHLDDNDIKNQLSDFSDSEIADILHNNASRFFEQSTPATSATKTARASIASPSAPPLTTSAPAPKATATATPAPTPIKNTTHMDENDALIWHPKYNIYALEQSALLISETLAFCLQFNDFPFLANMTEQMRTDGVTEQQLISQTASPHQAALYIYQTNQLQQQGILVKKSANDLSTYETSSKETANQIVAHANYQIINLSIVHNDLIEQWTTLIEQSLQQCSTLSSLQPLTFLLVDDFLHSGISDILSAQAHWCLLKISGDKLWITSQSSPERPISIKRLQQQLWHNQPARKIAQTQNPNKNNNIPLNPKLILPDTCLNSLRLLLKNQLSAAKHNIGICDITTHQVEHHPINPYFDDSQTFAEQIQSKVQLQPCPAQFNQDGGSRSIPPEQTLANLNDLISPITGVITHIQAIHQQDDKPVKIYESSFFKTPPPQHYATLDNTSFIQRSFGKGVEQSQSKASGLGESIERFAALYQGDEPLYLSKQSALSHPCYEFDQISPFSSKQYDQFARTKDTNEQQYQAAQPYDDSPIHWLPCWSLSHQQSVYMPLTSCFFNLPFNDEQFGKWNSNGCAAGNTIEEAIIQGLYEVIERDAIGIWWYNKIPRPSFDLSLIPAKNLSKLDASLAKTHHYWVLDLTTDIGVPVMVAVGQSIDNQHYAFGFGCHLEPQLAAQRALTELCQMIPIEDQNKGAFDPEAIEHGPYLQPQNQLAAAPIAVTAHQDISDDIRAIVTKLKQLGLETLALNYSRAHIPLKTTKVFVPGLCHMWPQLGNERLYQLPVKLGWLDQPHTEPTLNPQPLYV